MVHSLVVTDQYVFVKSVRTRTKNNKSKQHENATKMNND